MERLNPFWFKLEPQHIKDNLRQVILYLARVYRDGAARDEQFDETLSLLFRLADETVPSASPDTVRLFGAAALASQKEGDPERTLRLLLRLYECLALAVPKASALLARSAVTAFTSEKITLCGYSWNDLLSPDGTELFATRAATSLRVSSKQREAWYQGKGTLEVTGGKVILHARNRNDVLASKEKTILGLSGLPVEASAEKKDEERTGSDAVRWFLSDQLNMKPVPRAGLQHYGVGDTLPVRFTGLDRNGNMTVESADPDYEPVAGVIRLDAKGTHLYRTEDLVNYLPRGCAFLATWEEDARTKKFSFRKPLFDFITSGLRNEELDAFCTGKTGDTSQWWTSRGFLAYCTGDPLVHKGMRSKIYITSWNDKGSIRCQRCGESTSTFTEGETRSRLINGFAYPEGFIFKRRDTGQDISDDTRTAASLGRLLAASASSRELIGERIAYLTAARMLAVLSSDEKGASDAKRTVRHMENLRHFADGEYGLIVPWDGPGKGEIEQIDTMLPAFASSSSEGEPATSGTDALKGLVDAALTLRENGLASAEKHVITEICRLLDVQTKEETDEDTTYNLGAESGTQEFKTSVFFAPAAAKEQDQMKTIRKVVCAFLNAPLGGTLYIGVDDDGYAVGLTRDIEYMEKTIRGHEGIDGYLRYLRLALSEAFPQEVWTTLGIEPVLGGKAVAVRVPPCEGKVVSLEGTAWYRFGSECIRMSPQFRKKLEQSRKPK